MIDDDYDPQINYDLGKMADDGRKSIGSLRPDDSLLKSIYNVWYVDAISYPNGSTISIIHSYYTVEYHMFGTKFLKIVFNESSLDQYEIERFEKESGLEFSHIELCIYDQEPKLRAAFRVSYRDSNGKLVTLGKKLSIKSKNRRKTKS